MLLPEDRRAPEDHRVENEEEGVEPVLKAAALFLMNELVLGDEETGEDAQPEVEILMLRTPGEIQKIEEGRKHCQ